jgi:hypothetical protein
VQPLLLRQLTGQQPMLLLLAAVVHQQGQQPLLLLQALAAQAMRLTC